MLGWGLLCLLAAVAGVWLSVDYGWDLRWSAETGLRLIGCLAVVVAPLGFTRRAPLHVCGALCVAFLLLTAGLCVWDLSAGADLSLIVDFYWRSGIGGLGPLPARQAWLLAAWSWPVLTVSLPLLAWLLVLLTGAGRPVTGPYDATNTATSPAREWLVWHGEATYGPYSIAELRGYAEEGRLRSDTLVWVPGQHGVPLGSLLDG
ncbi:DUF4339 domain-containing protein [Nocardioides sp.]|uniref:DUF4339 domain-containing protein n=1 Tax=Nocardioides sp. TaxID=35761 RepID=UPI0039E42F68